MSAYSIMRLPSRSACQNLLFDLAPICGRSVALSQIAIRRTTIHLLARLAVAAMCTSSAAAFDAAHISRLTVATVGGRHSLEFIPHQARPDSGQSVPAAIEARSFVTTGRGVLAKSQSASERKVEVQLGEPEEIGKQ